MMDRVLDCRALVRRYRLGDEIVNALDGVDLVVQRGETVAVTGPSGSGKSTLLGLIAGLDRPDGGSVSLLGQDLGTLSGHAMARFRGRHLGVVFQSYRLLPALTALENVRVPLDLAGRPDAGATALAWLDRVGLAARSAHLPARLSGGEQQRVALARALAPEPALVLADEPTGSLDGRTGSAMADLLFSLVRERQLTLLLVTHDIDLAQRCDRIIELRDGRVVESGLVR